MGLQGDEFALDVADEAEGIDRTTATSPEEIACVEIVGAHK